MNPVEQNNNNTNLSIYQKYLELIYYTNNLLIKFPRSEKFALSSEIKQNLYQGLNYLLRAIKLYNKREKLNNLFELDVVLSILKVQVRLSDKYKYISKQNYTAWSTLITDICNMLGGWINSCQKK